MSSWLNDIVLFLQEFIKLVQPVFLGKLIQYFENYDPDNIDALHEAYGYAAGVSVSTLVLALMHHLYFFHVLRAGMRFRVAMCHMIYKKVCISMGQSSHHRIDSDDFYSKVLFLCFIC